MSHAFQPAFQRTGFAFQQELVTQDQPSGGWEPRGFFYDFDAHRAARLRRKEREAQLELDAIEEETSREIAQLLHEQERLDAERKDLERIQALADQYAGTRQAVPRSIAASLLKAQEERTKNALEQLQRELERLFDEEEQAVVMLLLNDD